MDSISSKTFSIDRNWIPSVVKFSGFTKAKFSRVFHVLNILEMKIVLPMKENFYRVPKEGSPEGTPYKFIIDRHYRGKTKNFDI